MSPNDQLFLLSVEYTDPDKFAQFVPAHREWLIRRYEEGHVIVSGGLFDADGTTGREAVAILRAADHAAAEALVSDEPFNVAGICRNRIQRFNPRMHSSAFDSIYSGPESTVIAPTKCV